VLTSGTRDRMEQDVDDTSARIEDATRTTGTEITPRTKEAANVLSAESKHQLSDDTRHDVCSISEYSEAIDNAILTDKETFLDDRIPSPSGQSYVDKLLSLQVNITDQTLKYRAFLEKSSSDSDTEVNLRKRYPPIAVRK